MDIIFSQNRIHWELWNTAIITVLTAIANKIRDVSHQSNGIIYCHTGSHKSSAVVLQNGMLLTSGLVLLQIPNIAEYLEITPKNSLISVRDHPQLDYLHKKDYRLILGADGHDKYVEKKVRVAYMIHSEAIEASIEQSLKGLKFLLDGEYKYITEHSQYFATFVLLQAERTISSPQDVKACFRTMRNRSAQGLKLMSEIVCVSSPFGNEYFLNSVNYGHVVNIIGKDNCLTLLNVSSAFGCEGGGIYDRDLNLQSILLGSCFIQQNDNVCYPLAANISEIYKILSNHTNTVVSMEDRPSITKSTCLIETMGNWGTGCLFRINDQNFVLTCAHVLTSEHIFCYCDGFNLKLNLLYKNPIFDHAYDIALLNISNNPKEQTIFCQLASYVPQIGQIVYSVGFPIFKSLGTGKKFSPSIYRGRVTKYSKGLLFTDCPVQAGQSGGPIYDAQGNLLAVMVSNFKSSLDDRIHPHHNMCIPICDIYEVLHEYSNSGDLNVLNKLQADSSVVNKWKLRTPRINSQL